MAIQGNLTLPKMKGREVSPGIFLIGDPTPIEGTNLFRCLANVGGALCIIELKLTFKKDSVGLS